jgi:hypothetical protein
MELRSKSKKEKIKHIERMEEGSNLPQREQHVHMSWDRKKRDVQGNE